ncbi:MAG: Gfo/Idh/MocA family oxidoreductase [Lentisphaeria bacterium]|nr:Gfo/Idh/MocA family oxidoreductase [Lentisphaeria bacterium]
MAGRSLSRRTFLRGTGASVLAGPLILPRLLGEEASGNRLALGVIGVGGMGGGHLGRALGTPETVVVAVCDVDGKRREAARQRVHKAYAEGIKSGQYRGCDAYADFRELTRRPDIDAVIIATPDHWHALVCADAARNGKDIYCEKPLTLTIGEARELTRIVRRYGRVFQTGSQQRSEYQ